MHSWQCLLSRTSEFVPVNDGTVQQTPGRKPDGLVSVIQDNVKSGTSIYRISANSFCPWIVSAPVCTVNKGHST